MLAEIEYRRRAEALLVEQGDRERRWRRVAVLRASSFALAAILFFTSFSASSALRLWALLPAAAFVFAIYWHARIDSLRRQAERLRQWYEDSLSRLRGKLPDSGAIAPLAAAAHPYATDLDILGEGSLFVWLCHAQTASGKRCLSDWLCDSASAEEIALRQSAVEELRDDVGGREKMLLCAAAGMHREAIHLRQWVELPQAVSWIPLRRVLAFVLAIGLSVAIGGWLGKSWGPLPMLALSALAFAFASWCGRSLTPLLAEVDQSVSELATLHRLLAFLGTQQFRSARLLELQERMGSHGEAARMILGLRRRLEMLDTGRNPLFAPLAMIWLWRTQWGLSVERWRKTRGQFVLDALDALGEIEALQSLARGAYESEGCRPEIVDSNRPVLRVKGVAHPLLPADTAVRNDVELDGEGVALWIISGSNMSGKSTLLRSVGANAVLALAGGMACAESFEISVCRLGASIRAGDSLLAGESRFAHELARLKTVVELATGGQPTLFLLDELLHGTHSHDRREGAAALLKRFLALPAIGMISTHDLELCKLEAELPGRARNVHFLDEADELDEASFDYRLREGVVTRTNALRLMRRAGLFD